MKKNEFIEKWCSITYTKEVKKDLKKLIKDRVKQLKTVLKSTQYDLERSEEYQDKYYKECLKTWNEISELKEIVENQRNEIIKPTKTNTMNHYEALVKRLTNGIDSGSSSLLDLQQLNTIVKYIEEVEREATAKGVGKEIYIVFDENKDIHKVFCDVKTAEKYCRANKDTGFVFVRITENIERPFEPIYNVPIKFKDPENECCIESKKIYCVTEYNDLNIKKKYFKDKDKAYEYLHQHQENTVLEEIILI